MNDTLRSDFEDSIEKSLKSLGYHYPTSDDEVDSFEANNKLEETPENYNSAIDLLSKAKHTLSHRKPHLEVNKSIDNLARAARNGGNIPEDILKRMKSDRDKAENDEK
jgi:hypothetical protein